MPQAAAGLTIKVIGLLFQQDRHPEEPAILHSRLRIWSFTTTRLLWGIYLLLSSIYCLLAFLPYTFFALIKAPAYEWMPWFAHHQAALYWLVFLGVAITRWADENNFYDYLLLATLAAVGVWLTTRPFLPALQNDWPSYRWSLLILAPLAFVSFADLRPRWLATKRETGGDSLLAYASAIWIAALAALISGAGAAVHTYSEQRALGFDWARVEITSWSIISHVLVALIIVSLLNVIRIASRRTANPQRSHLLLLAGLTFIVIGFVLVRFLDSALSFSGWPAYAYAACFSLAATLFLGSLVLPFRASGLARSSAPHTGRRLVPALLVLGTCLLALFFPTIIGGGDWNGVLQHCFTLFFWIVLSIGIYHLRPRSAHYSVVTIITVLLITGFAYKSLQATEIFWAKPLGSTDDEVSRALETYAVQDVSFQLAHHILGNDRAEPCGDLCRILREYTNIRDAEARQDVNLVPELLPAQGPRPSIFILVIDSLRPDYLGAYNPRVDFSPNLDAFAHDSIALRNVYTQYAGTTLSEPAIWAGTMLLHAHYMQPFSRVNGLEKLANADGYQMVVSYDTVLSQILSPNDQLIKLDTDKTLWNHFEACSTLQQTETALDTQVDKSRPVLFYAQPMNVHQFANNNMPRMTTANWRMRDGFNNRIAYEVHQVDECFGSFVSYLKSHGWYDNSIIVVTSDHGDATGEFGRYSHSLSIFPEVIRVPLLVHLPASLRGRFIYDDTHLSALTDITPSLYYLLGHRPVRQNPLFGHPLFVRTDAELEQYRRDQLFLASDERAVYGILAENGRFLYTTYDSPSQSFLFDLAHDPNAEHSVLTAPLKQQYDERLIDGLHMVADFYGYRPGVGSLLAAAH